MAFPLFTPQQARARAMVKALEAKLEMREIASGRRPRPHRPGGIGQVRRAWRRVAPKVRGLFGRD